MKISIKTIKGEVFSVEVELSETILDLKRKIEGLKGMEVSTQKLILKGANTSDEKTLESYGVKEGDFLVVMQTKKLAQTAQTQPTNVSTNTNTQPQQQPPKPQTQTTQPQPQSEPQKKDFSQESTANVVMGDKFNQTVEEICKMGFPKEDTVRALKAAFNNPDRAIDYLINGIPEVPAETHQHQQPSGAGGSGQSHSHSHGTTGLGGAGLAGANVGGAGQGGASHGGVGLGGLGQEGSDPFLSILNNPQLQMFRNLIRQQPQMLPAIMMQLQQNNPELFNLISQNQETFTHWLTEGAEGGAGRQNVIHVSPEEKEAIDRLIALGFDKQSVIQAYLACDKNEELAANLLFDQMNQGDFDDVPLNQGLGGTGVQQGGALAHPPVGNVGGVSQPQGNQPQSQPQPQGNQPQQQPGGNAQEQQEQPKEGEKKEGEQQGGDNKDKKNDKDDDDTIFS